MAAYRKLGMAILRYWLMIILTFSWYFGSKELR